MLIFQFVTKDDLFPIIFPGWPYLDTNSLMIFHVLLTVERNDTVDGQNPAPPRMMIIPLFIEF